jgi:hypothetical protein
MSHHTWSVIGQAMAALSGIGALLAALLAFLTIRSAERTSRASLMLAFDERLDSFEDINQALQSDGKWAGSKAGPTIEEMPKVVAYMGTLERIGYHLDQGLIELKYVERFYRYRYCLIIENQQIRKAQLVNQLGSWSVFVELGKTFVKSAGEKNICRLCLGKQPGNACEKCEKDLCHGPTSRR